ncbi:protein FAR1-RELATED SEQUENCE 5-like [Silene latifolia]|uniref:protein FAR1-RELATED SEQUENCE 5-like n=1 Tax=Silene latifolia TaxID=37657 RepID=UPI003D76B013
MAEEELCLALQTVLQDNVCVVDNDDSLALETVLQDNVCVVDNDDIVVPVVTDDEFVTMIINKGTDLAGSLLGIKAAKWEHIYALYIKHSQQIGFSVKKSTSRRAQTKERPFIERYFRCSCEGNHGNKSKAALNGGVEILNSNLRNVSITRCECKACVRTQVNEAGLWESCFAAAAGGDEFVGHTKRDHINYVNRLRMKQIEGGDAATLINMLTVRQAEEPGFLFRVQFNEEGRLSNIFWRDAMMREDYLLYRDVIIFDTTYRTNRYNLICGAFVGINNHWSNVMFGCAFLSNENQESFEWLFKVFNESMGDEILPVSIFTDQDQAIANAIKEVYPTSRHRLCQWHIQQNAISHFGKLKGDRPFQNLFNKCLNGCYNEVEFEDCWRKMLKDYGLEGHKWFKRLYKHRVKWSTALNNEYFSAGILSSQRSESTNHAIGFQATKTTSITAFFGIFETTVKRWRNEEERKEFNGIRSTPTSVYPLSDLLLHASQVYTVEIFRIFEREFVLAMGTRATILPVDDPLLVYRVQPGVSEEGPHHVTYDCSNQLIECTCRKLQVMGIFCSHIIRVLHMHSVGEIPSRYILRRWTKFSKTAVWERLLPGDIRRSAANDAINWRRSMLIATNHLITKCHNVAEARTIFENLCVKANEELQSLLSELSMEKELRTEDPSNVQPTGPPTLDPVRCTTKGRSARKKRNLGPKKRAKKATEEHSTMYTAVPRLI